MQKIRQDVDLRVTDLLGHYIDRTKQEWFRYIAGQPLEYETFCSWEIPLDKPESLSRVAATYHFKDAFQQEEIKAVQHLLGGVSFKNAIVYSPLSAMYWHTNLDSPGTRIYYTFSLSKAVFRYRDPETGKIYEDWDDKGWTSRRFTVSKERPLWHSIWSSGRRFSFGFSENPTS